jgi:general secretion pathway protein G
MIHRIQMSSNKNDDGFTLIELLIVIVVLGILAGIVVLGLGTFRADANAAACKADSKQVQIASDAWMASPSNASGASAADVDFLVSKKLLKAAPAKGEYTIAADGAVTRAPVC